MNSDWRRAGDDAPPEAGYRSGKALPLHASRQCAPSAGDFTGFLQTKITLDWNMNFVDLITVDPDILGGVPVFKGTRVPVKTLFEYLEKNYTLEEFLECFPSVTRDMACRVLERSESALLAPA